MYIYTNKWRHGRVTLIMLAQKKGEYYMYELLFEYAVLVRPCLWVSMQLFLVL